MLLKTISEALSTAKELVSHEKVTLGTGRYRVVLTDFPKEVQDLKEKPAFVVVGGKFIRLFEGASVGKNAAGAVAEMIDASKGQGMVLIASMNGAVVVVGPQTSLEEGTAFFKNNHRVAEEAVSAFFNPKPPEPSALTAPRKGPAPFPGQA